MLSRDSLQTQRLLGMWDLRICQIRYIGNPWKRALSSLSWWWVSSVDVMFWMCLINLKILPINTNHTLEQLRCCLYNLKCQTAKDYKLFPLCQPKHNGSHSLTMCTYNLCMKTFTNKSWFSNNFCTNIYSKFRENVGTTEITNMHKSHTLILLF